MLWQQADGVKDIGGKTETNKADGSRAKSGSLELDTVGVCVCAIVEAEEKKV